MADVIISRSEAMAQGMKKFFTGIECRRGHIAPRNTSEGKCCACLATRSAESWKRWGAANPEKRKESVRKWREANPEQWRESNQRSKQARQQIYTDRQRADYAVNPEKYRVVERRRRARKLEAGGDHTPADLAAILVAQRGRCAYCRVDLAKAKRHLDHITALSRGGSNARTNLQWLCAPCNRSKGAKDPVLFARELGRLV